MKHLHCRARPRFAVWALSVVLSSLVLGCSGSSADDSEGNGISGATTGSTSPASSTPSTPSSSSACADTSQGVCRIADAGVRQIALSRAGANGLALDLNAGRAYVVINGATAQWCGDRGPIEQGLSIVDLAAGREVAMVPSAESPVWPLVDGRRGKVYVAGSGGNGTVVTHNPSTGAIEQSWPLGGRPHDLGLDPSGELMLVSNTFDRSQTYISTVNVVTGAVRSNIQVPELPHKVVVDATRRLAYAVSLGSGVITEVDLGTGAHVREFGSGAVSQTSAMSYSALRRQLYVGKTGGATPSGGPTVVVIDQVTGRVVAEIGTFTPGSSSATRPWGGFGLDDANGLLYAAVGNSSWVAVVDVIAMKPLGLIDVAACPWAVELDTAQGKGYVSSNGAAALTEFDLGKVRAALGR